jgi:hypothetical protein
MCTVAGLGRQILKGGIPFEEWMRGVNRNAVESSAFEPNAFAAASVDSTRLDRVARCAHRHEPIERRERRSTRCNRDDVVDVTGLDTLAAFQARLAIGLKFELPRSKLAPKRGGVRPASHHFTFLAKRRSSYSISDFSA